MFNKKYKLLRQNWNTWKGCSLQESQTYSKKLVQCRFLVAMATTKKTFKIFKTVWFRTLIFDMQYCLVDFNENLSSGPQQSLFRRYQHQGYVKCCLLFPLTLLSTLRHLGLLLAFYFKIYFFTVGVVTISWRNKA